MNNTSHTNKRTASDLATHAEVDVPSRRIVLRGALAAGCSLLLPTALMGCDSPQQMGSADTDTLPPATGPGAVSPLNPPSDQMAAAPTEAVKSSQASVQYQAQPKGEQKCSNCMNFIAESNTCKRVEGTVSPQGWCIIWANAA